MKYDQGKNGRGTKPLVPHKGRGSLEEPERDDLRGRFDFRSVRIGELMGSELKRLTTRTGPWGW